MDGTTASTGVRAGAPDGGEAERVAEVARSARRADDEAGRRGVRRVHRISVAAGAVMLALVLVTSVSSPSPCGDLSARYPPIVAFELARSERDLRAVFGDGRRRALRCRQTLIRSMDTVNTVDLAVFMPAYGLFLIAALIGLRRRGYRIAIVGVGFTGLALVADVIENVCMLGLTPRLDPTSTWMAILPWATGVKWLALGAVGAVAALALGRGARRHRVSAAVCLVTPIATVAAIVRPHDFGPVVASGMAASWAILLLDGLTQAFVRVE